ncbi:MAG: hypothetical protein HFI09_02310, partial [Bacilli bacterium]|nr:hypothetical protein [Bacilli bacterium]
PMESGESGSCQIGDYMTHPAFISMNTKGLWVGKFETGYKGSTSHENAQSDRIEPDKVQIKPSVFSWTNSKVANMFYTSYEYKRELDSHMMKNTEWGAVAYLQHSKYGSMSSVRINNNSKYMTGYAGLNEPTCGYTGLNEDCNRYGVTEDITRSWNTEIGYTASTTGNISGIYDMSGGTWEFVMGVMMDSNGVPMSGRNSDKNSGFNGPLGCPTCDYGNGGIIEITDGINFPQSRYYDKYIYSMEDVNFQRRILGDATGEMGPFGALGSGNSQTRFGSWYQDAAWFVWYSSPWFRRGATAADGNGSGIFTFSRGTSLHDFVGFRVVLSI